MGGLQGKCAESPETAELCQLSQKDKQENENKPTKHS